MECIEARALKSSFLPELAVKSTQQLLFEDIWCVKGINRVVPCEDFSVDDLFDFSDKDFKDGSLEESEEDEEKEPLSAASSRNQVNDDFSTTFSSDFISLLPTDDLSVPVDDLENLEWLSQFVDDSASELSLLCPAGKFEKKAGYVFENRSEPQVQKRQLSCFESPVPSKVRSKRLRPSWSVWSLSSPSLSDTSSVSSSTSSHDSNLTSPLLITNPVRSIDSSTVVTGPPAKKQKRKLTLETVAESGGCQTQRRCSHCGVQKTPQWRAGPMGAKTLCNACGVRFKSGRLLPEYRPACSPTYSVDIHSNSHRKVLELRRKKEMSEPAETDLTRTVPSFGELSVV